MAIVIDNAKMQAAIDQAFTITSRTPELSNTGGFSFANARSIVVVTINPVQLEDYDLSANLAQRLAAIADADTESETYTISQRKSFAQKLETVDKIDQLAVTVGRILEVQMKQEVVPAIDKYRIAAICAVATANSQTVVIKPADGYDNLLDMTNYLTNANAIDVDKLYFVDTKAYKSLRQSGMLVPYTETERRNMVKGTIGMLEDMTVRQLPDSYFPTGFHACAVAVDAGLGPIKHQSTQVIDKIPGSFASVVQGLLVHDYFARKARKLAFAAVKA